MDYPKSADRLKNHLCWVLVLLLGAWGCTPDPVPSPTDAPYQPDVPAGLPPPPSPAHNPLTAARVALGRQLFYDPALSRDSSLSCASCHRQEFAFADNRPTSPGIDGRPGQRNVPSLGNVAYHPYYLREGGVPTLEMQVGVPVHEANEFDFNMVLLAERLAALPHYQQLAQEAYQRAPDPYVITAALAAFQRTLLTGRSAYDAYVQGGHTTALSLAARRGMALFFSDSLACSRCHSGFDFSNYAFANNGLYEDYPDAGRWRLTGLEADRARFKTPSLRNVAVTAPYMHDGSLPTLAAVVAHYQSGGKPHPNRSPLLGSFTLTPTQVDELVAFLEALTDTHFLTWPGFGQ